jgi:ketosteroid isomerase-like protein
MSAAPDPASDLAIRMARAAFNRALAAGDLAAIGPILAHDAVLIAGTDSALIFGRKGQLQAWKREFAANPRTLYTRTPQTVTTSPVAPVALEQGNWTGVTVPGGDPVASGMYSAKWRKSGANWVIEGELYLTLA